MSIGPLGSSSPPSTDAAGWFSAEQSGGAKTPTHPPPDPPPKELGWLAALTPEDSQLLAQITAGLSGQGPNILSQLAGDVSYTAQNPPDFLAVRTGPEITSEYAVGYTTVGWVDGQGNNVSFFATGDPPHAGKCVAITFGQGDSNADRRSAVAMAMKYLNQHLYDTKDASGNWSQPTFDVRV